jgi:hypothetical protein
MLKGVRIYPMLSLWSPSLFVQMQGCHFGVRRCGIQKSSRSFSQSPFILLMLWVYHCSTFSTREKGNNFHLKVSCVMLGITKHKHSSSNSCKCRWGSSFSNPKKVCPRTMAHMLGWSSQPEAMIGFGEGDGSKNSSSRAESWWIERFSMV